jgi:hypothetical protein
LARSWQDKERKTQITARDAALYTPIWPSMRCNTVRRSLRFDGRIVLSECARRRALRAGAEADARGRVLRFERRGLGLVACMRRLRGRLNMRRPT